ncbi:hypothetical protein [Actinomadura rudentiformis]|nr:hypothetical protein [Actinomadura rudentiformis]
MRSTLGTPLRNALRGLLRGLLRSALCGGLCRLGGGLFWGRARLGHAFR